MRVFFVRREGSALHEYTGIWIRLACNHPKKWQCELLQSGGCSCCCPTNFSFSNRDQKWPLDTTAFLLWHVGNNLPLRFSLSKSGRTMNQAPHTLLDTEARSPHEFAP